MLMLLRRRLMQSKISKVNLFNKNSQDILYNMRLRTEFSPTSAQGYFVSHYIPLKHNESVQINFTEIITTGAYSIMNYYDINKRIIDYRNNSGNTTFIRTGIENCEYIRFTGLMTDIDNITVYKI